MKSNAYASDGGEKFQLRTFFSLIIKAGLRFENWPFPVPFPDDLQASNFASPQAWPGHLIELMI
jgi:hypothetical protein